MMVTGTRPMAEPARGEGEALERARQRRKYALIAGLTVIGFVPGFYLGFTENDQLLEVGDKWPPALALALATIYLLAIVVGGLVLRRQTDEVALHNQYRATSAAATSFVVVYPLWYLLWKGGFVPEPMHVVIYVIFIATALAATAWYRFR